MAGYVLSDVCFIYSINYYSENGKLKELIKKLPKIKHTYKENSENDVINCDGLIVDKLKPDFGNSNDGNTARRFFQNAEITADITKIDVNLIKQIYIILVIVSSGHKINIDKFCDFTHNTVRYFVAKCPWYNMSPTHYTNILFKDRKLYHMLCCR